MRFNDLFDKFNGNRSIIFYAQNVIIIRREIIVRRLFLTNVIELNFI